MSKTSGPKCLQYISQKRRCILWIHSFLIKVLHLWIRVDHCIFSLINTQIQDQKFWTHSYIRLLLTIRYFHDFGHFTTICIEKACYFMLILENWCRRYRHIGYVCYGWWFIKHCSTIYQTRRTLRSLTAAEGM